MAVDNIARVVTHVKPDGVVVFGVCRKRMFFGEPFATRREAQDYCDFLNACRAEQEVERELKLKKQLRKAIKS